MVAATELKETIRQSFRKACLMRLEGREAEAVKILQEELPPYVKQWQGEHGASADDIETFFAEELSQTESAHWMVSQMENRFKKQVEELQTKAQAEAMQSLMNAQLQLGFSTLKERLQAILGEVVTYQGAEALGGRVAQELSERVKQAVDQSIAEVKSAVDTLAKPETLHNALVSLRGEIEQIVQRQIAAHDERVGRMVEETRKSHNEASSVIIEKTQKGIAGEISILESRQAQREALWQDAVKAMVEQVVRKQDLEGLLKKDDLEGLLRKEDIGGLLKKNDLDGLLKKGDLESAFWQAQNAIGEKLEGKLKSYDEAAAARATQVANLTMEVKTVLAKRLESLVTAESFESRLMATASMVADAQAKALNDAANGLKTLLEKRLSETTGPIYQRMSAVLTAADWERMTRELNEKFLGAIVAMMETRLAENYEKLAGTSVSTHNLMAERSEAMLLRIQDISTQTQESYKGLRAAVDDSAKILAERLAGLYIENAQQQTDILKKLQADLTNQQTQAMGMLAASQQNFLMNLQRDWEKVGKAVDELKARQTALENSLKGIAAALEAARAEQLKTREGTATMMNAFGDQLRAMDETFRHIRTTLPQSLQGIERIVDTKMREHAALNQAELSALQRRMESGIADNFAKKLENIRLVSK